MRPLKKSLLSRSALTLGLIFSTASTICVEATTEAPTFTEAAPGLCILTAFASLMGYFWFRKPLKEERFDKEKLKSGTWKERLQNTTYFFADKIIGWPYKEGKKIYKLKPGVKLNGWRGIREKDLIFSHYKKPPQKPAGALGYFQAYVLYTPMSLLLHIISPSESYTFEEQKKIKKGS